MILSNKRACKSKRWEKDREPRQNLQIGGGEEAPLNEAGLLDRRPSHCSDDSRVVVFAFCCV